MRDLAFAQDVTEQLRLLKTLTHFMGDIHQPMHVSFEDDKGGNLISASGLCGRSLHAAWDSCLIEKTLGFDSDTIATSLEAEITSGDRSRWLAGDIGPKAVASWANETFTITTRPEVGYCERASDGCRYSAYQPEYHGGAQKVVVVDEHYLSVNAPFVRDRIKAAGVRLGAVLNSVLMPDQSPVGEYPERTRQ